MALKSKSLFLYGFKVDGGNSSLDFRAVSGGPELNATLAFGYYSLSSLLIAIKAAMQATDPSRVYTVTANRTTNGGLENRITISTNGIYLDLLFGTGSRITTSVAPLIGFAATNRTLATVYTGTLSSGIVLVPEFIGYNFLPVQAKQKVFGTVNVSASGEKESVVFNIQKFWQVEFRYEAEAVVIVQWEALWTWLIQQRLFEFTPEIGSPSVFYEGTLESSSADGKGLGFTMAEMLPNFPFRYQTGMMTFRQKNN